MNVGGVINGRKVVLASYKKYGNWRIAYRNRNYGDMAWYYAPRGMETVTLAEKLQQAKHQESLRDPGR